nr:MAG TPA: zinc-ribbon containing domain protein [Caudoviricetes sp.]
MKESEAIKELHSIRPRGGIIPQKRAEVLDVAIQALEKQIPKKVLSTQDKEFALCPCCNGNGLFNKQKYCDNCGCKLDWSDEE